MTDRRVDAGLKIGVAVLISAIAGILALFIQVAWSAANEGKTMAVLIDKRVIAVEISQASMVECLTFMKDDLNEIKNILKRTSPYERAK